MPTTQQQPHHHQGPVFVDEGPNSGELTLSRRIARYLSKYKWYYPERDNPNVCLDEAWSHFERVTLPRHFCDNIAKKSGEEYEKAGIGEIGRDTKLYSVWKTPFDELADFGLGVGMYFASLRILIIILLVGGVLNAPAFAFYRSEDYTGLPAEEDSRSVILQASAVCPNTEFVPCANCDKVEWILDENKYVEFYEFVFVKKNICSNLSLTHGFTALVSIAFVMLAVIGMGKYNSLVETRFDENDQTSQDYSIIVKNIPPDEYDPDVYKKYFEEITGEHVTVVSIALNNTELLKELMERRKYIQTLHNNEVNSFDMIFEKNDSNSEGSSKRVSLFEELNFSIEVQEEDINREATGCIIKKALMRKVMECEKKIRVLYKEKYEVCRVFITFESEIGQRTALNILSNARSDERLTRLVDHTAVNVLESLKVKGRLPYAKETMEPSAIRWVDFGVTKKTRYIERCFAFLIVFINIFIIVYVVGILQKKFGPLYASLFISVTNTLAPLVTTIINREMSYNAEGSSQMLLYTKITLIRWTSTAIVLSYITPFTKTLSQDEGSLLASVYALFITEAFTAPVIKYFDILSSIRKHILAPRIKTQLHMNINFKGTRYHLAERYTDMTKVLFVTCFYSVIFPPAYFFGALSLLVYYWIDKFLVMRTWSPAPALGSQISEVSRGYFLLSILTLSVMSAYWWSGFPYDNLCSCEENPDNPGCDQKYPDSLIEAWNSNEQYQDQIINLNINYYYCNQDFLRSSTFPPTTALGSEWMDDEQTILVDVFGWISVGTTLILGYALFGERIIGWFKKTSRKYNSDSSKNQFIDFSCISEIYGYVPQMAHRAFEFPMLVCDIDGIDSDLIYWQDEKRGFDFSNVIYDVPGYPFQKRNRLGDSMVVEDHTNDSSEGSIAPVFSIVAHYPPTHLSDDK